MAITDSTLVQLAESILEEAHKIPTLDAYSRMLQLAEIMLEEARVVSKHRDRLCRLDISNMPERPTKRGPIDDDFMIVLRSIHRSLETIQLTLMPMKNYLLILKAHAEASNEQKD